MESRIEKQLTDLRRDFEFILEENKNLKEENRNLRKRLYPEPTYGDTGWRSEANSHSGGM